MQTKDPRGLNHFARFFYFPYIYKILLSTSLAVLLLLSGCSETGEDELVDYLNEEYAVFLEMDHELNAYYDEYELAAEDGDEHLMYEINRDALNPQLEAMYDHVSQIALSHEDNQSMHEMLINEVNLNWQAVQVEEEAFVATLEDEDHARAEELFNERDQYYDEAYDQMNKFLVRLDTLVARHDIVFD